MEELKRSGFIYFLIVIPVYFLLKKLKKKFRIIFVIFIALVMLGISYMYKELANEYTLIFSYIFIGAIFSVIDKDKNVDKSKDIEKTKGIDKSKNIEEQ